MKQLVNEPEFTKLTSKIKFLIVCYFVTGWILIEFVRFFFKITTRFLCDIFVSLYNYTQIFDSRGLNQIGILS